MTELTNQSVGSDRAAAFGWTRRHVLALAVLCLAALLDTIDVTVVNVAMPAIRNSLHFSEGGLAWMVDAYMVPFGGFLLLGGRTGDILGRRRVLLAGTGVFALASLGSALAPSAGVMIATRAAEGIAAAFVVPMTLAMLSSVFPPGPARNRAFAVWGSVSAAAGTLGLVLGGVLVSTVGWRWIFLVNVPVGALVMLSAVRVLPPDGRRARGSGLGGFDVGGAVSGTAGASLLAYAVAQTTSAGWGSGRTIGLLCGAAALIGYFVFHEARVAAAPLMPLSLWRNRSVTGANVVSALLASAMFAVFYATTLYMQQVLHYSALRTGLAYVPFGLSILVAAGARADRGDGFGRPRDVDRRVGREPCRARAPRPRSGRRAPADRRHPPDRDCRPGGGHRDRSHVDRRDVRGHGRPARRRVRAAQRQPPARRRRSASR